ncbi:MAG: Asp-tRNA(Asn)/Glu-tRNA(Gln) amidotransferase subunit GatA, partial [Actinobacteria bacterium]|nr:Asp-tRNA(Asn)/Glu-tRNA(Gln) amidotransferase subunit GatA [Actinomycetota bacterium]
SVSRFGMIAFASSLDQAGPFTRDVTDAALLYGQMTGADPHDATAVGHPETIRLPTMERLDGLRLGVPDELASGEGLEPGVLAAFEAALEHARGLGAAIERVTLPTAPKALSAYYVLAPAECSSNLSRFDGVRYGMRSDADDLLTMYTETRHDGFGPEVRRRILIGTYALSSGYYDAYYGTAQRVRTLIMREFDRAFGEVDAIVTPTSPTVAFELGAKTADPLSMYLSDFLTVPMSLAGIPAISIPCGLSDGLPVGLQIAGPAFSENRLLETAYALERALEFDGTPPRRGAAA